MTEHISSFVQWIKLAHSNDEWVRFHIERYGPLLFFLGFFHYWSLHQSVQSESYHLRDILCHHLDMWHISLIADWLLLAFSLLQILDAPLLSLGPLVTCYLLPWHGISGLQQSFVLGSLLFHLRQEMNLLLTLVEHCCHMLSPYNFVGKAVSLLAVYAPPWIGVFMYIFSLTVCRFCYYASVYSPILVQCLKFFCLPNPLIFHGNF